MKKKYTLFTVAALSLFALGACSSGSEPTKGEADASTVETTTVADKTSFAVGDTIVFDGSAEYTITAAEWTDERNEFADSQPEKVLKVTYNMTNLSDEDQSIGMDMNLYVGGKKMETYPNTNTMDSLSAGRTYEGAIQHFAVNGTGDIELEVQPILDFSAKPAIVTLTLP